MSRQQSSSSNSSSNPPPPRPGSSASNLSGLGGNLRNNNLESIYSPNNLNQSTSQNQFLTEGNLTETRKRQGKKDEVSFELSEFTAKVMWRTC